MTTDPTPSSTRGRSWRYLRFGLAPKVLGVMIVVVVGAVVVMTSQASNRLAQTGTQSFESKGEAIALSLAAASEQNVGRDLSTIQGAIDSNKVIDGVLYIFLEDSDRTVTVHTFSPTFPRGLEALNGIAEGEILPSNSRVKIRHVDFRSPIGRIRAIDVAAPASGGALGTVHVGMDLDRIERDVGALRLSMLFWGGAVAIIGILLGLLVTGLVVLRPIGVLTRITRDIVARGDLTQKITISSRDEIGELANTFGQMVDRLREVPLKLRETTEMLMASVDSLSQSAGEQTQTVTRQAAAVQETQVTVQEIKQTSLLAAQKAEAVLKVAERADEVSRAGEVAIAQSLGGLADIRTQVEEIAQKIGELQERTRQIGLITETVKDLADQSNMLALNAAIEAVRSGEHGKGFAVVAREIRNLADQSIQATNRVREILDDIGNAIRSAVSITEKGAQKMEGGLVQMKVSGENLRELSTIVKDNAAAVRQIAAAVSQQNAGISQIFGAVSDLNQMMDETLARLEHTGKSVDALRGVSEQVSTVVTSFRV